MSKKATNFQRKVMSVGYRGKEIFKPLNTGWIDDHVGCVREWVANIYFYKKGGSVIMIDAGYNYERLAEKMGWLDIDPAAIGHILITHQDTDHVGAVEADSGGLFRNAKLYIGEIENRYLTGEVRRKVIFGMYKLPMVTINNEKILLKDGDIFYINDIKIEAFLVPGHTWGHIDYLIDDKYLFTGDTIWLGADGGYSFINGLAEDNKLAVNSLEKLEKRMRGRNLNPIIITGHTGWTDDLDFAFAHRDKVCDARKKQKPHDPGAPYDGYDESGNTEEKARSVKLPKAKEIKSMDKNDSPDYKNWVPGKMVGGSIACTAALAAANAAARKSESLPLKMILGVGLVGAGAFTAWSVAAHQSFSYGGKRQLSRQIIEGTAKYITIPEGGTGLDVGCGSGALTIACAKRNPQAKMIGIDRWGMDYSNFSKALCESNAQAEGVQNVSFLKGDAVHLDFPDETFDAVTSNYVYHNITGKNKQELLVETLRVLKKGGTFAIHDLMSKPRYGDIQAFAKKLKEQGYEQVEVIDTTNGMFMSKSEATLLNLSGSTLLVGKK